MSGPRDKIRGLEAGPVSLRDAEYSRALLNEAEEFKEDLNFVGICVCDSFI